MSKTAFPKLLPLGAYPERVDPHRGRVEKAAHRLVGPVARRVAGTRRGWSAFVRAVTRHGAEFSAADDGALRRAADELREPLRREGFRTELVARAFALVREVATRVHGQRHYDVQLIGGLVLLRGMAAEMETGEGKTLTATLPAATAGLAGIPVHIVTVNDYLAARDAEQMGAIYRFLGLSVGLIVHGLEPDERRAAYLCDVTYCTNKELTFDYLRDRITLGRRPSRLQLQLEQLSGEASAMKKLLLRGLFFAIVDEADSVLVDEARVPLIISGPATNAPERELYHRALDLADQLEETRDFRTIPRERTVELTDEGRDLVGTLAAPLGGLWTGRQRREELVGQALAARHLFVRDTQYIVRDGKVQIVDEFTGRVSADRSWERGLHQLIEAKEGVDVTAQNDSLARISYQRFFRRYLRLAGMTGTAQEITGELWAVYRLPVVRVPTNRPIIRRQYPDRVFRMADEKWTAIVARIKQLYGERRPVLVGTRSVAASEHLSALLNDAYVPHVVLNARQDATEAEIVSMAGQHGRVTVATNMAGRGTDIVLAPGIRELGGLHVIATERHEAGRIDRQLFGRCGRQGDPGSYEAIVSLEDELVQTHHAKVIRNVGSAIARASGPVALRLVRQAQLNAERLHARMRRDLLKFDEQLESTLAFAGRPE